MNQWILLLKQNINIDFGIDEFRKKCLIEGLDDIALTLQKNNKIDIYEEKIHNTHPWIV